MGTEFDPIFINDDDLSSIDEFLDAPELESVELEAAVESSPETTEEPPQQIQEIPHPPPSTEFDSFDELYDYLQSFHRLNGAALVKRASNNKKVIDGKVQYMYYRLACDRGPRRPSVSTKLRPPATRGNNCKFVITAHCSSHTNNRWIYKASGRHHHGPSLDPSAHIPHRKRTPHQQRLLRSLYQLPGVAAREATEILREAEPFRESYFTQKDIYNDRQALRQQELSGLTATQAWIGILRDQNIKHFIEYVPHEPDRVLAVFWTYPWCETQWKRFPEVIGLDNTYKTNRFKMPLFHVTGLSDQQSVVNLAYGLIDNERDEGYLWLCRQLNNLREDIGVPAPAVVITDKEAALRKALRVVFPHAQQQLCVWHMNTNVDNYIKKNWNSNDPDESVDDENLLPNTPATAPPTSTAETENPLLGATVASSLAARRQGATSEEDEHSRRGMFLRWKSVVFAQTVEEFEAAWATLCRLFPLQERTLQYIESEYMGWMEHWAQCYIRHNRNFGMRVTSSTESGHKDLKSFLIVGTGDLLHLHYAIVALVAKKKRAYIEKAADQAIRQRRQFMKRFWLRDIVLHVGFKAIDLLAQQARYAEAAFPTDDPDTEPMRECTGCFIQQYSLPCAHRILECFESGESLQLHEIHPRWWLHKPLHLEEPLLRIRDPEVVQTLRGRPKIPRNEKLKVPAHLRAPRSSSAASSRQSTPQATPAASQPLSTPPSQPSQPRVTPRQSQSPHNTRRIAPNLRRTLSQHEIQQDQSTTTSPTPSTSRSQAHTNTRATPANSRSGIQKGRGGRGRGGSALSRTPTSSFEEFIPATQSPLREEIICAFSPRELSPSDFLN